jgi:hypothetical protein
MQVDRGFFEVAVSQQHLDRAQIGTGVKQMRCEAMAAYADGCVCAPGQQVLRPADSPSRAPWWLQDDSLCAICCREKASR